MKFIIVILILLSIGCPNVPLEEQVKIQENANNLFVLDLLPPNSSIVKKLDSSHSSGWYVVEIKIDEKTTKQYLLKWWCGSHGEKAISLVEINNLN